MSSQCFSVSTYCSEIECERNLELITASCPTNFFRKLPKISRKRITEIGLMLDDHKKKLVELSKGEMKSISKELGDTLNSESLLSVEQKCPKNKIEIGIKKRLRSSAINQTSEIYVSPCILPTPSNSELHSQLMLSQKVSARTSKTKTINSQNEYCKKSNQLQDEDESNNLKCSETQNTQTFRAEKRVEGVVSLETENLSSVEESNSTIVISGNTNENEDSAVATYTKSSTSPSYQSLEKSQKNVIPVTKSTQTVTELQTNDKSTLISLNTPPTQVSNGVQTSGSITLEQDIYEHNSKDKQNTVLIKTKNTDQSQSISLSPQNIAYDNYRQEAIDTISICSEEISCLASREIARFERKQRKRKQQRQWHSTSTVYNFDTETLFDLFNNDFTRTSLYSPCSITSSIQYNTRNYVENSTQTTPHINVTEANNTKYELNENQIKKIATALNLNVQYLQKVIESTVSGCDPPPPDIDVTDEIIEIGASQSPVRRRYTSSQSLLSSGSQNDEIFSNFLPRVRKDWR